MEDLNEYLTALKIGVTDEELRLLNERAAEVIGSFAAFDGADADGFAPMPSVLGDVVFNITREDTPERIISRKELLSAAPREKNGYIAAPGTLL